MIVKQTIFKLKDKNKQLLRINKIINIQIVTKTIHG